VKQILCIKLFKYGDKYTEMRGQQNVKKKGEDECSIPRSGRFSPNRNVAGTHSIVG
jgi:hypothetical protein